MNSVSSISAQKRCLRKYIMGPVPVTNGNFSSPALNTNYANGIWNVGVPPGWTLGTIRADGSYNAGIYVNNGITNQCNIVSSTIIQYISFAMSDTSPAFLTQNINISVAGMYEVTFYTSPRPSFHKPVVTCSFNGKAVTGTTITSNTWFLTSLIVSISTPGSYPLLITITGFYQDNINVAAIAINQIYYS